MDPRYIGDPKSEHIRCHEASQDAQRERWAQHVMGFDTEVIGIADCKGIKRTLLKYNFHNKCNYMFHSNSSYLFPDGVLALLADIHDAGDQRKDPTWRWLDSRSSRLPKRVSATASRRKRRKSMSTHCG